MDAGAYIACENEQCVVHQSLPLQRRGHVAERLVQHRHHACNIKAMPGKWLHRWCSSVRYTSDEKHETIATSVVSLFDTHLMKSISRFYIPLTKSMKHIMRGKCSQCKENSHVGGISLINTPLMKENSYVDGICVPVTFDEKNRTEVYHA